MKDEEIIVRVQRGETEQFGVLVERYEEKMRRYARKFLFFHQDIDDIVQEVFIKAYRNIQSFDTSRAFSPWLYRVAHNEFISAIRKKKHETVPLFDADTLFPHLMSRSTTEDMVTKKEMRDALRGALSTLPLRYREIVVLYYEQELDYATISDILRIPLGTVGVRLSRARALLKKEYEKHHGTR